MFEGGISLVSSFSTFYKNMHERLGFPLLPHSKITATFPTDGLRNDSSAQQKPPVWMAGGVTSSSSLFLLKDARVRETDSVHYHASLYRTEWIKLPAGFSVFVCLRVRMRIIILPLLETLFWESIHFLLGAHMCVISALRTFPQHCSDGILMARDNGNKRGCRGEKQSVKICKYAQSLLDGSTCWCESLWKPRAAGPTAHWE